MRQKNTEKKKMFYLQDYNINIMYVAIPKNVFTVVLRLNTCVH